MWLAVGLLAVLICLGFGVLYFLLKNLLSNQRQPEKEQQQLEQMVDAVFGKSAQHIAEQSRQILASEKDSIKTDLANKQATIEKLVKSLQDEMRTRQQEIRELEQDRSRKFGEMTIALEHQRKLTDDLRVTTQQLATVLSNNQARGGWGERIIEDLLQSNGLIEGVHYAKQLPLNHTTLRPDITLLLPNKRVVPVDVKFPFAEIQKLVAAEGTAAKNAHLKQFATDLRLKITKVAEYINPEYDTLDYAILFVPNEMVFSFINQKLPEVIDEALAKRVILVSPFSFLIVARTVIESYRNFMLEDKLKDIVRYVSEFVGEWANFQDELGKFGRSIETLSTGYTKLMTTRTNQLDRKIKKIEEYQRGTGLKVGTQKALPIEE
jgi:DNA recombination protein RmuC